MSIYFHDASSLYRLIKHPHSSYRDLWPRYLVEFVKTKFNLDEREWSCVDLTLRQWIEEANRSVNNDLSPVIPEIMSLSAHYLSQTHLARSLISKRHPWETPPECITPTRLCFGKTVKQPAVGTHMYVNLHFQIETKMGVDNHVIMYIYEE